MFVGLILTIFSLVSLSTQQKDPIADFCRISGHQTTVVDRKLYIDGGTVNWNPLTAGSLNYTSQWLRVGDLDTLNQGFPQQKTLAKDPSAPSLSGGTLWADETNKIVYQYGGEYTGNGIAEDFQMWSYDIIHDTWNTTAGRNPDIHRAAWGAGAVSQDKAKGYYYGGYLTNASVPSYGAKTPLSNFLIYDMIEDKFTNQTGPDDIPRAEGVLNYVPAGDAGLLVYFGGIEFPNANGTSQGLPMTDIFVYSIGDNKWYKENASGSVPENRRRFCAGAAWAADKSSYNIYLYGGASIGEGIGFGDVYVLSLPSFKWIKFWPHDEDKVSDTYPHHSTTCNVIGNSQMIVMGGAFPSHPKECDVPEVQGQHGLDMGRANDDSAAWAPFNPNLTTYHVPPEIVKVIGGSPSGGATAKSPEKGFQQRDLQVQFSRTYTPVPRTATRELPSSTSDKAEPPQKSNKTATIGAAVGGAVGGVLIIAAIAFCVFYRRRKARDEKSRPFSQLPAQGHEDLKSHAGSVHMSRNPSHTVSRQTSHATMYSHTLESPPPLPGNEWQRWGPPSSVEYYSPHSPSPRVNYPKQLPRLPQEPHELPTTEPQELPSERFSAIPYKMREDYGSPPSASVYGSPPDPIPPMADPYVTPPAPLRTRDIKTNPYKELSPR